MNIEKFKNKSSGGYSGTYKGYRWQIYYGRVLVFAAIYKPSGSSVKKFASAEFNYSGTLSSVCNFIRKRRMKKNTEKAYRWIMGRINKEAK